MSIYCKCTQHVGIQQQKAQECAHADGLLMPGADMKRAFCLGSILEFAISCEWVSGVAIADAFKSG